MRATAILIPFWVVDLGLRLPWRTAPYHRDEALYSYVAQELLRGVPPYVSVLETKGVLLYVVHAIGLLLGGFSSEAGPRVLAALADCATLAGVGCLALRWRGPAAACVASLCWILASLSPFSQSILASSEAFTMPFVVWSLVALDGDRPRPWLAGVALGLALQIRQTSALFLLASALWMALGQRRALPALLGPFAALAAATPLAYWLGGQWDCYRDAVFAASYVFAWSGYPLSDCVTTMAAMTAACPGVWVAGGVAAVSLCVPPGRDAREPWRVGLLLYVIAGLLACVLPCRYYARNALQVLPFACIAAGLFAGGLANRRGVLALFVLALLATGGLPLSLGVLTLTPEEYGERYVFDCGLAERGLGRTIGAATPPGARVYNWGNEWGLYFYSERRASTRLVEQAWLIYAAWVQMNGHDRYRDRFEVWQRELQSDLESHPPDVVVVSAPFFDYDYPPYVFPDWLVQWLARSFRLRGTTPQGWGLYVRRGG